VPGERQGLQTLFLIKKLFLVLALDQVPFLGLLVPELDLFLELTILVKELGEGLLEISNFLFIQLLNMIPLKAQGLFHYLFILFFDLLHRRRLIECSSLN